MKDTYEIYYTASHWAKVKFHKNVMPEEAASLFEEGEYEEIIEDEVLEIPEIEGIS